MVKYLAFDASDEELVVCACNGKKYLEKKKKCSGTEHLMLLIDETLKKLRMDISEVEFLGACVGPGSWTGTRVSVVTLYGLVSGLKNVKTFKFNAFDLISYNDNIKDEKLYLVKAYANFVYVCDGQGNMSCKLKDEVMEMAKGKKLVSRGEVLKGVKQCKTLKFREVIEEKIASQDFVNIEDIEPIYLRLSQAEYQREQKLNKDKN